MGVCLSVAVREMKTDNPMCVCVTWEKKRVIRRLLPLLDSSLVTLDSTAIEKKSIQQTRNSLVVINRLCVCVCLCVKLIKTHNPVCVCVCKSRCNCKTKATISRIRKWELCQMGEKQVIITLVRLLDSCLVTLAFTKKSN